MQATVPPDLDDEGLVLTGAAPSRLQRLMALAVVPGVLAVLFLVTRPFAEVQLPRIPAFTPLETAALFVIDLVTATIFFSQFSIARSRALLLIASGYLYAGLMLIPYLLAFPGLFAADGPLVGGLQSTAWLYILKHCGLAGSMAAFALASRSRAGATPSGGHRLPVLLSVLATMAIVTALGALCILGDEHLPVVASDGRRFSDNWIYFAGAPIATLYALAVLLLWRQRGTVLGLWLTIVACVHFAGVPLSFFGVASRFSVGWYTVVLLNLVANSLVLVVLLVEVSNLYRRVLQAVRAQQHEREARLVTGDAIAAMIAHEVKQPLTGMITRAAASFRRLDRPEPDVTKAKDDLKRIAADGHRAAEIIDGIRANFRLDQRERTLLDARRLITDTLALVQADLRKQRVAVRLELEDAPSMVAGSRTQLQQVLMNLIANGAEAAGASGAPRILTLGLRSGADSEVILSVADTGPGVSAEHLNRIFDPLFTTKPAGMGMGLSICRSIVGVHGGRIWVSPNLPHGAAFHVALPVHVPTSSPA